MISDPVRGLSRRHGSVRCDSMPLPAVAGADEFEDASTRREDTIFIEGVEYGIFRKPAASVTHLQPIIVVNKDEQKLVPVVFSPEGLHTMNRGVSTICTVGKYVLFGSARNPASAVVTDNVKGSAHQHSIWIRGGAYSRTFVLTATTAAGIEKQYTYTTMKSYYDKPLDTSDIPHLDPADPTKPNPNYNKLVNDRSNAYNSAVNKHIADAAKDITPENIAKKLCDLLKVDHPQSSTVGPYIATRAYGVTLSIDDGGNGEFVRASSKDVDSPEQLTPQHYPGKVMIVQPKAAGSIPYYMQATSATGATGFTEVVWKEVAGEIVRPSFMFMMGMFRDGTLYVGHTPSNLRLLTGDDSIPMFELSTSGDTTNRPLPNMFGRVITYMQSFQDRLLIVAGSTVFMSRTGDYFSFFPSSMLLIKDDDPIEVFALGTEDDTITAGVQMDRNVVLFGKRYQYVVSGRERITPRNAYVGVAATYKGSHIVPPSVGGALMFFCQRRENRLTMQQMQPGSVADRLDAFDVSAQLDGYLHGTPQQLIAQTSPSVVFIKTKERTNGFYVYSFLDSNDQTERLYDSWSRWEFDKRLGVLVGITSDDSGLLAVTVRTTSAGSSLVLDRFSRETDTADRPYLDSQVDYVERDGASTHVAYKAQSERAWIGSATDGAQRLVQAFPTQAEYLTSGVLYDSYVELTSPYLRDAKDRVILDAKLTVTKLTVSLANSAAMVGELTVNEGRTWKQAVNWLARKAGGWVLNTQPVETQKTLPIPVMKDNKTYRVRMRSLDWLPLTISVVEWAGQAFTSRR